MSARLVRDASITLPLLGTANDEESIAANSELANPLRQAITRFAADINAFQPLNSVHRVRRNQRGNAPRNSVELGAIYGLTSRPHAR